MNATTIMATTPAPARGLVDVVVTNPGGASATLANGYRYGRFDPNGDNVITVADVLYLASHLFGSGPAPVGGVAAGDANGDGSSSILDIFNAVNFLFNAGPEPV